MPERLPLVGPHWSVQSSEMCWLDQQLPVEAKAWVGHRRARRSTSAARL